VGFALSARALGREAQGASQQRIPELNQEIRTRNLEAGVSLALAGAAAAAGAVLWFWPEDAPRPSAAATPGGAWLGVGGRF
jgi:hypothetical protein